MYMILAEFDSRDENTRFTKGSQGSDRQPRHVFILTRGRHRSPNGVALGKNSKRADFDEARDRLFHEMRRCGVLEATDDEAEAWLGDTVEYLGEEFPSLTRDQLDALRRVGRNYCSPVIPHGSGKDATNREEWSDAAGE